MSEKLKNQIIQRKNEGEIDMLEVFRKKNRQVNKLAKDIRMIAFSTFGIKANDGFDMSEITNHIKIFNNFSELESELNKLACYIYNGKRTIFYHEFRKFPYINHGDINSADASGLAQNYTNTDIYLIKFIRKFLKHQDGKYKFFDVDFIIKNTKRIELSECSILDMPIDEILR